MKTFGFSEMCDFSAPPRSVYDSFPRQTRPKLRSDETEPAPGLAISRQSLQPMRMSERRRRRKRTSVLLLRLTTEKLKLN